jgi:hypothetical protein
MQKDSAPDPDEASARHHCLDKEIEAPDLATVKDFLRFYIATSRGKIVEKPTADSLSFSPASPVSRAHRQMKKTGATSTR